jgi:2-polyprenyl-6-methoxyphenol hydroxylase-like FAD-dependent oxidoreductase
LSQYVPIFGEVNLPPEKYEGFRHTAKSAILAAGPGLRLQGGMLSMAENLTKARFFWVLMPREEELKSLSDWVQKASKQEIYDFVIEKIKDLYPIVKNLTGYDGRDAIAHLQPKFSKFVPPHYLSDGRTTILGDAAHAMIPFKAAGANTAILDACDLCRILRKLHEQGADLIDATRPYLAKMIPRDREAVLSSRAAGDSHGDDPAVYFQKFRPRRNS